jgi:hypothetical protein
VVKTSAAGLNNASVIESYTIAYNRQCRESEFLGAIVSASTFAPPGSDIDTALRCRKRPERKQCQGLIVVHLQENPVELRWWCPVCGDCGVINTWKGIPWKKTHIRSIHENKKNKYCKILLHQKDFQLLREISILQAAAKSIVQNAETTQDGILLEGNADDIDTLIRYIAFEANHEQKPHRQRLLNGLFDTIYLALKGKW